MVNFIARGIKKAYDNSPEEGCELYRKYFINTKLYTRYKEAVDEILTNDGYEDVIVEE